jgi:hypothetical protein
VNESLVTAREIDMWERGELPGFTIGRAVRFRPAEVEAWLEERRRGPAVALARVAT